MVFFFFFLPIQSFSCYSTSFENATFLACSWPHNMSHTIKHNWLCHYQWLENANCILVVDVYANLSPPWQAISDWAFMNFGHAVNSDMQLPCHFQKTLLPWSHAITQVPIIFELTLPWRSLRHDSPFQGWADHSLLFSQHVKEAKFTRYILSTDVPN